MHFSRLQLSNFRNFTQLSLQPAEQINLFIGANASGKTSILEAIYLLSFARSFRSARLNNLIQHTENQLSVFGAFTSSDGAPTRLGLVKNRAEAQLNFNLNSKKPSSLAEVSSFLPLQLINADVFLLLDGSPQERRKFLDWGVFHLDADFLNFWRRYARALKQRNNLLKIKRFSDLEMNSWENELSISGTEITAKRRAYLEELTPFFNRYLASLLPEIKVELSYSQGWDKNLSLADYLHQQQQKDLEQGFTQGGPQRADLRIYANKYLAKEVLSRGQQKLVVTALKLAQARLLQEKLNKSCIFLIDDLPAELDTQHQATFCQLLEDLGNQTFITSVDEQLIDYFSSETKRQFHVKYNQLHLVSSGCAEAG